MEYFALVIDSKDKDDKPIAKMGKKIIYLHKSNKFDKSKQEINGNDIEPIPYIRTDETQNLRYFIVGASGVGKSTLTAILLRNYLKLYPDQDVFLLSALKGDPAFDNDPIIKKKLKHIDILDLEDIDVPNLKNSIVVVDDASVLDKKHQKKIDFLVDEIARRGRHENIDLIVTTDKLLGGLKTAKLHTHANYLGYFPIGNKADLVYYFKKKIGFDNEQTQDLLEMNSRWKLLNLHYPHYVISSNRVEIIS